MTMLANFRNFTNGKQHCEACIPFFAVISDTSQPTVSPRQPYDGR